jgi:hypothetical protein
MSRKPTLRGRPTPDTYAEGLPANLSPACATILRWVGGAPSATCTMPDDQRPLGQMHCRIGPSNRHYQQGQDNAKEGQGGRRAAAQRITKPKARPCVPAIAGLCRRHLDKSSVPRVGMYGKSFDS